MILAVLLFLTALISAQTNDARALLEDIASFARATKSWRAEGVEIHELSGNGIQLRDESRFKIAVQGPSKMRWETSGDDNTFVVCDGTDHWTYYSHGLSFYRNSVSVSPCKPALGDYSQLTDNLTAAMVIGRDQIQFAGGPRECDVVRAEYTVPGSPDGSVAIRSFVHTMCIDAARRLILRDSGESTGSGMRSTGTITYTFYEREPKLWSDVFEFQVSTGIAEDEGPQTGGDDPIVESGVYRMGPHVSGPILVYKVEPSYTEEARQARVSGMVLVSLAVDPSGKPQNIRVVNGLGHGLDEKVIEAVSQWRYRPGMKDGAPATVGMAKVVVNFRLP
jgi:TonB family protein